MLEELITRVKSNMLAKGKTAEETAITLWKIRQHYINDELFNPQPPEEVIDVPIGPSREGRLLSLEAEYQANGDETGKWVFGPETATKLGASSRKKFGRTDMHLVVSTGDLEGLKQLLEEKADPTLRDNSGYTPYQHALLDDRDDMIKLFNSFGITK